MALSMGMSGDFEEAVVRGATTVRFCIRVYICMNIGIYKYRYFINKYAYIHILICIII
jgi:hypothetical protein